MSTEKHGKLIDLLLSRTRANTLEWRPSVMEGRYQVSFRENTVRLYEMEEAGELGGSLVQLELINDQGNVAETINDEELDRDVPMGQHYWFKKMSTLFEMARRNALGSDKILDEIIADLEDDVPF